MDENIRFEEGTENIFEDLGFYGEEAKEELLKAQLGLEIFHILENRKLTQKEAGKILGIKQPEISRLKHGKFSSKNLRTIIYNYDCRLLYFLQHLSCSI